jgi:hypothetical protein
VVYLKKTPITGLYIDPREIIQFKVVPANEITLGSVRFTFRNNHQEVWNGLSKEASDEEAWVRFFSAELGTRF